MAFLGWIFELIAATPLPRLGHIFFSFLKVLTWLAQEQRAENSRNGTEQVVVSHFVLRHEEVQLYRGARRRFRSLSKRYLETVMCERNVTSSQPGGISGQLHHYCFHSRGFICGWGMSVAISWLNNFTKKPQRRYVSPPLTEAPFSPEGESDASLVSPLPICRCWIRERHWSEPLVHLQTWIQVHNMAYTNL